MHLAPSRLLVIFVFAAPMLGGCDCGGGNRVEPAAPRVAKSELPPNLELERPTTGYTTRESRIEIRGTTLAGSEVTVNGHPVATVPISDTDGELSRFEAKISLRPGRNVIDIEATYDSSPPARRRIRVNRRTTARLTIVRPRDGATTRSRAIGVRAKATAGSQVTVDGKQADLVAGTDDLFVARVPLELGRNRIRVTASKKHFDSAGRTITVTRKPKRPPPPCHPAYRGACLPPDHDVNCPDIHERNFRSVGDDPYRLDGNHNGIACEL